MDACRSCVRDRRNSGCRQHWDTTRGDNSGPGSCISTTVHRKNSRGNGSARISAHWESTRHRTTPAIETGAAQTPMNDLLSIYHICCFCTRVHVFTETSPSYHHHSTKSSNVYNVADFATLLIHLQERDQGIRRVQEVHICVVIIIWIYRAFVCYNEGGWVEINVNGVV